MKGTVWAPRFVFTRPARWGCIHHSLWRRTLALVLLGAFLAAFARVAAALASSAELKILAHPKSVRLVLEGISGTTAILEDEGPLVKLRLDPPVAVAVPPVPAAARTRLIAIESRQEGALLVLALEARTRARLTASGPPRIVVDLEENDVPPAPDDRTRTAGAAPSGSDVVAAPSLRVRSGRHPSFLRIVVEGPAIAELAVQPRDRGLSITGPPAELKRLARYLEEIGSPIAAARLTETGLMIELEPSAKVVQRMGRPDQLVFDLQTSPDVAGARSSPTAASARASGRSSVQRNHGAQTSSRSPQEPRSSAPLAGETDRRPCPPVREGQLCLLPEGDGTTTRVMLLSSPRPRAAAFSLGDTLWIVLDRPFALIGAESASVRALLGGVVRTERLPDAFILAVTLPRALTARLEPIEEGWQLFLTQQTEAPTERLLPRRAQDGRSLFLPVDGRPVLLPAQLVGSDLWALPTREVSGLSAPLRAPDLEFLASHQGYLLRPKTGDLWLRSEDGGVRIGRASGLRLAGSVFRDRRLLDHDPIPQHGPRSSEGKGEKPELGTVSPNGTTSNSEATVSPQAEPSLGAGLVSASLPAPERLSHSKPAAPLEVASVKKPLGEAGAPDPAREALPAPPSATSGGKGSEIAFGADSLAAAGSGANAEAPASSVPEPLDRGMVEALASGVLNQERGPVFAQGAVPVDKALESATVPRGTAQMAAASGNERSSAAEMGVVQGSEPLLGLLALTPLSDAELAARRTRLLEQRARAGVDAREALGRELARIALARGQALEALSFLDDPPAAAKVDADPPTHPATRALAGAAAVLASRIEPAERLLSEPGLKDDPEVALFLAVAAAMRREWSRASELLAASNQTLAHLPPALLRRLAEPVARIHLEAGRTSAVLAVVDRLLKLDPEPRERQRLRLLQAFAHQRDGALAAAELAFADAAAGPDWLLAAEARFRATVTRFERGAADLLQTLRVLEQERLMWREHPAEAEMLDRLFALQKEAGHLEGALASACARLMRHAHAHGAEALLTNARELLASGLRAEPRLDPVAALAIVRDCPQLTGADPLGVRAGKALAERLAAIGLRRVAADLLIELAARVPEGNARGELILEAALGLQAAGQGESALALLEREQTSLASRADLATRAEQLRASLQGSNSLHAAILRAQLMQARSTGDWRTVARVAEQALGLPLVSTERRAFALELVAALAALGERERLRAAADSFAAEFGNSSEGRFFRLLVSQTKNGVETLPVALQQELAALRATLGPPP